MLVLAMLPASNALTGDRRAYPTHRGLPTDVGTTDAWPIPARPPRSGSGRRVTPPSVRRRTFLARAPWRSVILQRFGVVVRGARWVRAIGNGVCVAPSDTG